VTLAITHVDALEVLDSRGTPTVQARVLRSPHLKVCKNASLSSGFAVATVSAL
jgi:enolase